MKPTIVLKKLKHADRIKTIVENYYLKNIYISTKTHSFFFQQTFSTRAVTVQYYG